MIHLFRCDLSGVFLDSCSIMSPMLVSIDFACYLPPLLLEMLLIAGPVAGLLKCCKSAANLLQICCKSAAPMTCR